jgi:hypothetical protein
VQRDLALVGERPTSIGLRHGPDAMDARRTLCVRGADTLAAMTETNEPEAVGPNVFSDPIPPFADEIEAELEDGTRIRL